MRTTPALLTSALLGTAVLSACTGPAAAAAVDAASESNPAAEATAEITVLDVDTLEGDEGEEISLHRPEPLTLSEFSDAEGLVLEAWGGPSAVATGRINGMFCAAGFEGAAYEITLVLCEVVDDHYRRFGVFGDFPEFDDAGWAFGRPLSIGGVPAGDDDWGTGCAEPEPDDLAGRA